MSITAPEKNWWLPLNRDESTWLKICIVVGLFLFFMMPIYHLMGKQNNNEESYRISPKDYTVLVNNFVRDNAKLDANGNPVTIKGLPVVAPKAGVDDIFILARRWQFYPILELEKGRTYRLHLSSTDLMHGFSLQPKNINFQVVPGYDQVVTMTPRETGEFYIICNEFCEIGHHTMIGKLFVK